jgi:hypothetical protein
MDIMGAIQKLTCHVSVISAQKENSLFAKAVFIM